MLHENAESIRKYLHAGWGYQRKFLRFIENHDEPRAVTAFGENCSRVAAIIALTLPGAKLIHEGQMRGYKIKLPVQLGRRLIEEDNKELMIFYQRLLKMIKTKKLGKSEWNLCKVEPVSFNNYTYKNIISYQWLSPEQHQLIVVNFSPNPAQGHVRIEGLNYELNKWNFNDILAEKSYIYNGEDLNSYGLYIDLNSWNGHIFNINRAD
jgi:hypothetical protein